MLILSSMLMATLDIMAVVQVLQLVLVLVLVVVMVRAHCRAVSKRPWNHLSMERSRGAILVDN